MLSVIIPARNAAPWLPEQLEGLAEQAYTGAWEVIVADNGSTDETRAVAEAWRGRLPVRVVDASHQPGVSVARNAGARQARGATLLFIDADDMVAPGWLQAMAAAAGRFDGWGGRLDETTLNDPRHLAWRGVRLQTGLTEGFLPHPQGANCGVRATAYAAIGGFDEQFCRGGGDDVEFFWRLQLAGYDVGFVPEAVVRYRHRGGLRALARQQFRYGRATAQLYREFARFGMPGDSATVALKAWTWLALNAPRAAAFEGFRGRWVRILARRLGRLQGSLEYRTRSP